MSLLGNIPPELRQILSRVKYLRSDVTMSWDTVVQRRFGNPEEEAKTKAADKLAHEFAGEVMRRGEWRLSQEPEGAMVSVRAACFTYDRLAALLMEAYGAGQKDGIGRMPRAELPDMGSEAVVR